MHSASHGIAGLFASVTNVTASGPPVNYVSACGIQSIAFEEVDDLTVVTPYAAFPIFLVGNDTYTRGVGLAWILAMIQAPRGQGACPAHLRILVGNSRWC